MEFEAPERSREIRALSTVIKKRQGNVDSFVHLLCLINGHPRLIGHLRVFENLSTIFARQEFSAASLAWADKGWITQIPSWMSICRTLGRQQLENPLPNFVFEPVGRHPIVGSGVLRHGVVAAIWNRHETPGKNSHTENSFQASYRYVALQSHLLASYIDSRFRSEAIAIYPTYSDAPERPIAPTRTEAIGRAVRELSHRKYNRLLIQLPEEASTEKYAKAVASLHFKCKTQEEARLAETIQKYFNRFLSFLKTGKPADRQRQGGGGSGGSKRVHGYITVPDHPEVLLGVPGDKDADEDSIDQITSLVLTDVSSNVNDSPKALETSGICPLESYHSAIELYAPQSLAGNVATLDRQLQAIETRNQLLPFDHQFLTPAEIESLEDSVNRIIDRCLKTEAVNEGSRDELSAALTLRLMFVLGRTLEDAQSIEVVWSKDVTETPDYAEKVSRIQLQLDSDTAYDINSACVVGFRIFCTSPTYKTKLPEDLLESDAHFRHHFLLPDCLQIGRQLLSAAQKLKDPNLAFLRSSKRRTLEQIPILLKSMNNHRINTTKISKVLPNQIRAQTGDHTLAWTLTAEVKKADEPRMFYTRYAVSTLVNQYCKAARRISKRHFRRPPEFETNKRTQLDDPPMTPVVGARFVTTTPTLKETIEGLKTFLETPPEQNVSVQWYKDYHLAYTSYTHLFQSMEVTLRSTLNPSDLYKVWLSSPSDLHFGCVNDKDNRFQENSRLVGINEALVLQFQYFQKHLEHIHLHVPLTPATVKVAIEKCPFFYINQSNQPQTLGPGAFEKVLKYFSSLSLPSNFHRSYLRTELLARACNPEVIDAYLGHANAGEQPFHRYSTFDYSMYREQIQQASASIRIDLGLTPLKSLIGNERLQWRHK